MNLKFTDLNALPDIKSTPQFDENGHTKRRREPFLQFDENGYAKKGNDVFSKFQYLVKLNQSQRIAIYYNSLIN